MKNTVKVTLFHKADDDFTKQVIDGCFWDEDQAQAIRKSGLSSVDSLYVSIPYSDELSLKINKGKDYIIQGETSLEIDNTSQKTQAESIKKLKESTSVFVVNSLSLKNHGSRRLWHWELSGK